MVWLQIFRDLGDYDKNHRYPLWIDKERELGKGAFGVVLRGELDNQVADKQYMISSL